MAILQLSILSASGDVLNGAGGLIDSSHLRSQPLCPPKHLAAGNCDMVREDFPASGLRQKRREKEMVLFRYEHHLRVCWRDPFQASRQRYTSEAAANDYDTTCRHVILQPSSHCRRSGTRDRC